MKTVSVLIPCHNAAGFVEDTLKSVLQNLLPEDEVIVVDDHSHDNSARIAEQVLSSGHVRYTVTESLETGACAARNHAFHISTGELIQWLDADDILGPDKISIQRRFLDESENSLVVSPFYSFIADPLNGVIDEHRDWTCPTNLSPSDWLASERMTIPACWLGHREVFNIGGPWNTELKVNQDGEYFTRALAASKELRFEPNTWAFYRRSVEGSVSRFTPSKAESLFQSIRSIHKTALELEDSHRMRQMVANKYQHAIYTAYPYFPAGIQSAKHNLRKLPKPTVSNPNIISTTSRAIAALFGWKGLEHMRLLKSKLLP